MIDGLWKLNDEIIICHVNIWTKDFLCSLIGLSVNEHT